MIQYYPLDRRCRERALRFARVRRMTIRLLDDSMPTAHLLALADAIDRVTRGIGRTVAWTSLFVVLVQFAVVLMRYALGVGSLWLQESIIYAHASLLMLAVAWTLREGGHVRVDIFYADASPGTKAAIDLIGALCLLLPFSVTLGLLSTGYVARSWSILERSRESSGLPIVFLLKTLIPSFALLLGLQGVSQAVRAATVLFGRSAAKDDYVVPAPRIEI
jgi:TRAP-type mannitol/chloroaromatic compound transport system permease small subunit